MLRGNKKNHAKATAHSVPRRPRSTTCLAGGCRWEGGAWLSAARGRIAGALRLSTGATFFYQIHRGRKSKCFGRACRLKFCFKTRATFAARVRARKCLVHFLGGANKVAPSPGGKGTAWFVCGVHRRVRSAGRHEVSSHSPRPGQATRTSARRPRARESWAVAVAGGGCPPPPGDDDAADAGGRGNAGTLNEDCGSGTPMPRGR